MGTLLVLDLLLFTATLIWMSTGFQKDSCYTSECPQIVKVWLVITFVNFYLI